MPGDLDQNLPSVEEKAKIERLLGRIKASSPIALLARSIIEGGDERPGSIDGEVAALTQFGKHSWRERRVAAWSLGIANLDKWQAPRAAAALERLILDPPLGEDRIWRPVLWTIAFGITTALGTAIAIEKGPTILVAWGALSMLFSLIPMPMAIPAYIAMDDKRIGSTRAVGINALSRMRQPLSAHVFARGVFDVQREVRIVAAHALDQALPLLSDDQFGTHHRDLVLLLCRLLQPEWESWHLPIVEALGKVGDGRAIDPLERLERYCSAEVRQAISIALPVLYERRKREQDSKRLLRPSQASDDGALLRPLEGRPESETEILLRSANAEIDNST